MVTLLEKKLKLKFSLLVNLGKTISVTYLFYILVMILITRTVPKTVSNFYQ